MIQNVSSAVPVRRMQPFSIDAQGMQKVMPHRFPIALLDRVDELDLAGQHIVARKCVTHTDTLSRLFLKKEAVFPPTLVVEAMAQASGMLMLVQYMVEYQGFDPAGLAPGAPAGHYYPVPPLTVLVESKVKQHRLARPGDVIRLESRCRIRRQMLCLFHVNASANGRTLAGGEVLLAIPPYGNPPASQRDSNRGH
ncbi:MAG TPA: hypothetical protein VK447_21580 [Myxococcaceae bacterium]|nr:hypothetical protein [Myxococcaceae bacterium]